MEDEKLREKCNGIIERIKTQLYENKRCIACYLLGSMSHDKIWKWSDIQFMAVFDDDYKGEKYYKLFEDDMFVALGVTTLSDFKSFLEAQDMDFYLWKAFSKSTKLFSKDPLLDDLIEDAFYIGDITKQQEMMNAFIGAVYYLNKSEKNLYVKGNLDNVIYFLPQLAENIAMIEIMNHKLIPEREVIPQGKRLNPELFEKIYDPLFHGHCDEEGLKAMLAASIEYLESMTEIVYEPVITYLKKHGNLENFHWLAKRISGFGENYDWLVRVGIAERYGIVEKISLFKEPVCRLGYRLKDKNE